MLAFVIVIVVFLEFFFTSNCVFPLSFPQTICLSFPSRFRVQGHFSNFVFSAGVPQALCLCLCCPKIFLKLRVHREFTAPPAVVEQRQLPSDRLSQQEGLFLETHAFSLNIFFIICSLGRLIPDIEERELHSYF